MTLNTIIAGAYTFSNAQIYDIDAVYNVDAVGNELSIDEMRFTVDIRGAYSMEACVPSGSTGLVTANGDNYRVKSYPTMQELLAALPYGTVVHYLINGTLYSKGYVKSATRTGKNIIEITVISPVGLLDRQQHNGGIYTGQMFSAVASEIIGNDIPYTISQDVANQAIYGWLPIATKRENLHTLLFSMGATIQKDGDGNMNIVFLPSEVSGTIPDERLFLGGSVDFGAPATRVEVTEHAYQALSTTEEVVLYDNTSAGVAADHDIVTFDAPAHTLRTEGLTLNASHVNFADVSGIGKLYGKPYVHTTRVVSQNTAATNAEPKTVKITGATLINQLNSENVAARCAAYYGSKSAIEASIVLNGEKAGRAYEFNDAFDEATLAYLVQMELVPSNTVRARCKFIEGYIPTGQGNRYAHSQLLTGSGTYTVPSGVESIRVIMGGGGHGGYIGDTGEDSTYTMSWPTVSWGSPGKGGAGGRGGEGGKVYIVTIPTSGGATFAYSCGEGGASNADGTASTFGSYSSASGASSPTGFSDPVTGTVYGLPGGEGLPGGNAATSSEGTTVTYNGQSWVPGTRGSNGSYTVNTYKRVLISESTTVFDRAVTVYPVYSLSSSGVFSVSGTPSTITADNTGSGYTVSTDGSQLAYWEKTSSTVIYGTRRTYESEAVSFDCGGSGGYGGGAAVGANGGNGGNGSGQYNGGHGWGAGGIGGTGATPTIPGADATGYCAGGGGGHGGGGGGVGGAGYNDDNISYVDPYKNGAGGAGGAGGRGGDGLIIVLY